MKVMKRRFAILLLLAVSGAAQTKIPAGPGKLSQGLDTWITNTETHLIQVAEAMPEDRYGFAPRNGEFEGVRTFAQQLKHLAANNYAMAALITGQTPTAEMKNETGPEAVQTKGAILDYLKGSFASLHRAVATIDEGNLIEPLNTGSAWQDTRLQLVIDAIAHSFDHYGQLVEYLRMNGVVPPASRPKQP